MGEVKRKGLVALCGRFGEIRQRAFNAAAAKTLQSR